MSTNTPNLRSIREANREQKRIAAIEQRKRVTEELLGEKVSNETLLKWDLQSRLEHNVAEADKFDLSDHAREVDGLMKKAKEFFERDKRAWQAHLAQRYATKAVTAAAGLVLNHFTVIGGAVLQANALIKTDKHIKNFEDIKGKVHCSCAGQSCESDLLPYIQMQKLKKFDRTTNKLAPVVSTLQTGASVVKYVNKAAQGTLHETRALKAKQLMMACKEDCPLANVMAAELLGNYHDQDSWTTLEAIKKLSFGWKRLYEKMAST